MLCLYTPVSEAPPLARKSLPYFLHTTSISKPVSTYKGVGCSCRQPRETNMHAPPSVNLNVGFRTMVLAFSSKKLGCSWPRTPIKR